MAGEPPSCDAKLTQPRLHDSSAPLRLPLREALHACSEPFEAGDFTKSDEEVAAVIGVLDSILESPPSDLAEVLAEIHSYVSNPSSNQMVVEALSYELPKVVVKFAELSDECRETAGSVMDCLVSVCRPRDMLSILCEALDTHIKISKAPNGHTLLLSGLSKVFLRLHKHHVEQVKVVLPVILRVQNAVSSESDEADDSLYDFFGAAVSICTSIQAICQKVERRKEELCAILSLYVLQNIALISRRSQTHNISHFSSLVKQFSHLLRFCGLSYLGLIIGCDVEAVSSKVSKGDWEDFLASVSLAMNGSSLPVIWGHISDEVAKAAGEELITVLYELRSNRTQRWKALGNLKHTLSSMDYPWEIKFHCIEFILSMMEGSVPEEFDDNDTDVSSFLPSLFAALQAIQRIIMGASNASSRKKAFGAFRKVISDLPPSQRVDMLKALITNCNSPSMIAILIDLVKGELLLENHHKRSPGNGETKHVQNEMAILRLWSPNILDFVELVLRPPKGGPPSLPEHSEPVLSALNLYRFILITESTGKTNHTGVLSESNLRKAHLEWLLPLRTLVSGIEAENEKDSTELADSLQCALNPVQLVLYRCIELVEDNLKHPQ